MQKKKIRKEKINKRYKKTNSEQIDHQDKKKRHNGVKKTRKHLRSHNAMKHKQLLDLSS